MSAGEEFDPQAVALEALTILAGAPQHRRKKILKRILDQLPPAERNRVAPWIAAADLTNIKNKPTSWERPALYATAVLFLAAFLAVALAVPTPTAPQAKTFRIILALMAGAFGAFIPGGINARIKGPGFAIKAASAAAFFVIVYLINPAA